MLERERIEGCIRGTVDSQEAGVGREARLARRDMTFSILKDSHPCMIQEDLNDVRNASSDRKPDCTLSWT